MIDVAAEVNRAFAQRDANMYGIVGGVSVGDDMTVAACGSWPTGEPAGATTTFYAASLTKQLIGLLTAISVEAGDIALDDSLRTWLPSLPSWTTPITIGHLLHHTSGLPRELPPLAGQRSDSSVLDAITRSNGPTSLPGSRFEYSNDGYVLLALALEQAMGAPIEQLADQRIFAPLGMDSSSLDRATPVPVADEPPPPATIGDGGWWTNIHDLLTLLHSLNFGAFGRASARLLERGKLADGTSIDYSWGVRTTTIDGVLAASHGGSWQRWQSKTLRLPSRNIAVAIAGRTSDALAISDFGNDLAARAIRAR
ncbi:D-alanyl-D-alanine carboxypeptidase [Frondihabitans sucicola]|uniref:D-alanyl-D-alanine carboxypeptidase n=1 Tax=Frondihabitans sucicola TaxID=1268041 RepID=A0ABM8GMR8_9MICO|nr:serine hydrolase domain-containing protein [Frondihabitans sucicola]BDZ49707.1 D-alanyl-D-alanine carboxypeptidase [Frondihabitans sucicola]